MTRKRRRPPGAFQGNAADPAAIKSAGRQVSEEEREEVNDMRAVLATPQGRRVLWRILEECKMLEAIWDPSVRMHFNAGRQDVGFNIVAKIVAADDAAWLNMQIEQLERTRRANRTAEAYAIAEETEDAAS